MPQFDMQRAAPRHSRASRGGGGGGSSGGGATHQDQLVQQLTSNRNAVVGNIKQLHEEVESARRGLEDATRTLRSLQQSNNATAQKTAQQQVQLQHLDDLILRVEVDTRKLQDGDHQRATDALRQIATTKEKLLRTLDTCWGAHSDRNAELKKVTDGLQAELQRHAQDFQAAAAV